MFVYSPRFIAGFTTAFIITAGFAATATQAAETLAPALATGDGLAKLTDFGQRLDLVWVIIAAALVLLMQIGFMLLEAGTVRSKNSINVAQKNLLDFAFATAGFAAVGFMFAFAASSTFPIGWNSDYLFLQNIDSSTITFFVFQVMFCGTAATIVSGAVAERMRLSAYVITSIVVAIVIYPVFVQWAWGNALGANPGAFLANLGFVDFAGSTVVHATGAWVALAACLILGPRFGRFDENGKPVRMSGQSPVLATAGAFLLFVGWIGFNGGSTVAASKDVPHIVLNTILAGSFGATIGYLISWRQDGIILPEKSLNGMLGGLVAVTAGCMVLDTGGAMLVGALGGAGAIWFNTLLEKKFKIDDAVGAIGVHGFAGAIGTIALAFLAAPETLPLKDPISQAGVQLAGVAVNFLWTFGVGLALFTFVNAFMHMRISAQEEHHGMNLVEHGTRFGIGHVEDALHSLVSGEADLKTRMKVEPGDEAEQLTALFNSLMDNLELEELRRQASHEEARTLQEASRMNELANATFEGLCIIRDGVLVDGNQSFEQLLGVSINTVRGRNIEDFVPWQHHSTLKEAMSAPDIIAYEIDFIDSKRQHIPVELRSREIVYQGVNTRVLAIVDLRERKRSESRIFHMAQHDSLTDLPNRALFNNRLAETLLAARRGELSFSLLFIDLDRFKDINDLHGHPAGDMVIRITADRLRKEAKQHDMVCRLGGDEFAIIQCEEDTGSAIDLAARIVASLAEPISYERGVTLRSGTSVGVVHCPEGSDITQEVFVRQADTALYHAKNSGRNCYALFEEGMDADRKERQSIEQDLHDAIEHGELENYYQPRMDVASGEIKSYEALVRWNHPWRGLLAPGVFIPVAEQSRKIIDIGDWVLRQACIDAMAHLGECQVSVNVSPVQLRDKAFEEKLSRTLEETGLPPRRLELEITENLLIDDDEAALKILAGVTALGVKVALDDFGTGYSSLSYLSRFRFNTVKIDRSFIRHVDEDLHAMAIVDSIFSLAHALNMRVVAEGVEEEQQFHALANRKCDEIQGYLIGRPMPVDEITREVPATLRTPQKSREEILLPI